MPRALAAALDDTMLPKAPGGARPWFHRRAEESGHRKNRQCGRQTIRVSRTIESPRRPSPAHTKPKKPPPRRRQRETDDTRPDSGRVDPSVRRGRRRHTPGSEGMAAAGIIFFDPNADRLRFTSPSTRHKQKGKDKQRAGGPAPLKRPRPLVPSSQPPPYLLSPTSSTLVFLGSTILSSSQPLYLPSPFDSPPRFLPHPAIYSLPNILASTPVIPPPLSLPPLVIPFSLPSPTPLTPLGFCNRRTRTSRRANDNRRPPPPRATNSR